MLGMIAFSTPPFPREVPSQRSRRCAFFEHFPLPRTGSRHSRCDGLVSLCRGSFSGPLASLSAPRASSDSSGNERDIHGAAKASRRKEGRGEEVYAEDERGELPYRFIGGRKFYMDEIDVVGFLDSQTYLRPLETDTFNPAVFLWKKIGDVPRERRHRILDLMEPRHIKAMWRVAQEKPVAVPTGKQLSSAIGIADTWSDGNGSLRGEIPLNKNIPQRRATFEDPGSFGEDIVIEQSSLLESAPDFLPAADDNRSIKPQVWAGKVSGLPSLFDGFMSRFSKSFFVGQDRRRYGRVILGNPAMQFVSDLLTPLYFELEDATQVLATEDIAELAFYYGDGHLQLNASGCLPEGFPPARQQPPLFNDEMRDYVIAVGPGVLVGQTWQEGRALEAIPKRFLGEFVLARYDG